MWKETMWRSDVYHPIPMCQPQSCVIIIIFLSFCSNVKQRAFMKPFDLDPSEASPYASFQLFPAICSSHSFLLCLPLLLVPWGFQSNVCLSVELCGLHSLWSVQCHCLSCICCSIYCVFIHIKLRYSIVCSSGVVTNGDAAPPCWHIDPGPLQ